MSKQDYSVYKVGRFDFKRLNQVCRILYLAGKDMSLKYGLNHWNNSYFKDLIIVFLCNLKNDIYIVRSGESVVATFQVSVEDKTLTFKKLATNPRYMGKGIGSFCLSEIERIAQRRSCNQVVCEVYDKSSHAMTFYENRGYSSYGVTDTLKYQEVKMKKKL